MEKSKLLSRSSNRLNTRTIGVNTDFSCFNGKCLNCQENSYPKFPIFPYFIPFPFCNCMLPCTQNNMMNLFNTSCKCDNLTNVHNCHHCLKNCSPSSDCRKCSVNTCENCHSVFEVNEENIKSTDKSAVDILKEESSRKVAQDYDLEEEISREDITKYANEYLEKSYRSRYESKQKIEDISTTDKNEDISSTDKNEEQNKNTAENRHLLNHLLKPDTKYQNNKVNNKDIEDFVEDNDEIISEDDELDVKTVIRSSGYGIPKGRIKEEIEKDDERAFPKINTESKKSHVSPPNNRTQTSKEQMLMMLTALVSSQYENNNTSHLNKLINQIGTEQRNQRNENKSKSPSKCPTPTSSNSSPRRRVTTHRCYANILSKTHENKKL